MTQRVQSRSDWRWPVRITVAGVVSVLVVVWYLAGLGEATPDALEVRRVAAPTLPDTKAKPAALAPSTAALKAGSSRRAESEAAPASAGRKPEARAASQTRPTPDGAVLDWIDALGRGDVKTAAALVGPKSRRYIESLGGNVEGFMVESQEGWGGWAQSADRQTTEVELGVVDNAPAAIVVISGTSQGEGADGFRTEAVPAVRIDGGGWVVEPTALRSDTDGRLEMIAPTRRSDGRLGAMRSDGVVSASAPGAGDFYFSLEDQPTVRMGGERIDGGVQATWDPAGELPAHRHLLVVAYADGDTLTAVAGVVDIT